MEVTEAIDLLFNPALLQEAIQIEDESDCDAITGLDWGLAAPVFINNPGLFGRLTQLRVSLNREVRLLLQEWNLGVGEDVAAEVARSRLLLRLQVPQSIALPILEAILGRDDLYQAEFIQDREVLQELLTALLVDSDWEEIAAAAASAIRVQVMQKIPA